MKLLADQHVRVVEFHTVEGVICVELYDREAPRTAESFCRLAESGQLDGAKFERMVPGFVLECSTGGRRTYGELVEPEKNNGLHHTGAGIVSCPYYLEDGCVAGEKFFVTLGPQPLLDQTCTVFGRIYSGMRVVEKISRFRVSRETFCLYSPVEVLRCSLRVLPKEHRVPYSAPGSAIAERQRRGSSETATSVLGNLE